MFPLARFSRFSLLLAGLAVIPLALWAVVTLTPSPAPVYAENSAETQDALTRCWTEEMNNALDQALGSIDTSVIPPFPTFPAFPTLPVVPDATATAATTTPSADALQMTILLCAGSDALSTERAIEQLIAGRSFGTTLIGRNDGCAQLTVRVLGNSPVASQGQTRQSTNLAVTSAGTQITVQITNENGATRTALSFSR